MVRKGTLQEIFSRARHANRPDLYRIAYRDYEAIRKVSLLEFIKISENFETIPASRIIYVKQLHEILYQKYG